MDYFDIQRKERELDDLKKERLRKEHFECGFAYFKERNYEAAAKEFSEILSLDSMAHNVYGARGMAYLYMGNFDLAIKDFSEAIKLNPESMEYLNRGDAYFRKGDFDNAIDDLNKAVRLDSNNTEAENLLEEARQRQKNK